MSRLTYESLRELWLYGSTLRELARALGVSQMAVHRLVKQYGLPDGRKRYSNGWLYCGSCHRHVHKSVALPSKLGPICPMCHRKLRRKSKEASS